MKKLFTNTTDAQIDKLIASLQTSAEQEAKNATDYIAGLEDKSSKLDVIMRFWPWIKPVLSLAKIFTNDKVDELINALIAWGDNYTENHGAND